MHLFSQGNTTIIICSLENKNLRARTLWTRLGLHSAVSPGVLVVGGSRIRAVISVGFCRVISSGRVYARVLVLVSIERLPVRGGAGRTVAVRDSTGGTVVARIRGRGLR